MANDARVGDDDVDFAGALFDLFCRSECFVDGVGLFGDFDEVDVAFVGKRGEFGGGGVAGRGEDDGVGTGGELADEFVAQTLQS